MITGINKILPSTTPGVMRIITFSNVSAIELPLTMDKNGYKENKLEDKSGIWWQITASGFIAGSSPELTEAFNNLNDQYVVIALDQDNNYKLIGSKEEPVHFITSFTTGSTINSLKGTSISFSRNCKKPPCFIQSPHYSGSGWTIFQPTPPGALEE